MIVIGKCAVMYVWFKYSFLWSKIIILAGSAHYRDTGCAYSNIPIWLIIFGCICLVQTFVNVCARGVELIIKQDQPRTYQEQSSSTFTISRCGHCIECILAALLCGWIFLGSVWVFGTFNGYRQLGATCDSCCLPYVFSLVVLLVMYSVGALCCCCSSSALIYCLVRGRLGDGSGDRDNYCKCTCYSWSSTCINISVITSWIQ